MGLDISYTDNELRELFRRGRNALRNQQQLSGTNGENGARFSVDGNGNQLFNVNGHGQMTISEIINNKNIPKYAEILTDSGNNIWGKITEDMAKAGKEFNLEALPIKFFKGDKWFGLVHICKHLSEFQNQNLSNLMEVIFGDINKIYARNDNGKIKLEIFPQKSRYYGILELRNDMDCYSIVSFYTRKLQFEKPKGKKVWVRSPQSAKSHATNDQSTLNVAPDKMLQEFQKELTAQNNININPLQADVKPESEKNQKKLQFSLKNRENAPQGGEDTDKVVIFADNIKNQADLEKVFAHETAGHKGLEVLLGNDYDNVIKQIYEEVKTTHAAELQKLAETYGKNLEVAADQKYIMEEFLANQADLEQAGFFKSLVQKIKMALRKCGFNAKWTDNEIKTLLRRSLAKQQRERKGSNINEATKYSIENAQPSKKGYTVEYVNENAGIEFNEAAGVICPIINDIIAWDKTKWESFFKDNNIQGMHKCRALNKNVKVRPNLPKRLKGHTAYNEKLNLIAVIPEMLNDAVLIQSEFINHNNRNIVKSHLLATKVRFGDIEGKRYIVGIIIHEDSMGNLYYDHEMTDIKNSDISTSNKGHNLAEVDKSLSTIKIIQKALLSSGFDVKSEKNLRFSLNEGEKAENFKNWFKDSKVVDENGEPI